MWSESGRKVDSLTRKEFVGHLRDALGHLHDAGQLRRSPLAALFGVANRFDTSPALRSILTDAIESLKPAPDSPAQSRGWRIYDSLICCYVQQLSQRVAADQLGLSPRQLRREQHAALEDLADRLWSQLDLAERLHEDATVENATTQAAIAGPSTDKELAWLKDMPPEKPRSLTQVLVEVLQLARPLASQHEVHLEIAAPDTLPDLAVHSVALSQILLNMLTVAILNTSAGGQVCTTATPLRWEVEIQVRSSESRAGPRPISEDSAASLAMARQLADLCAGELVLAGADEAPFSATATLPAVDRLPVLAVDDNADTLQLYQRYTAGTRYRLVGTRDPEQALAMADALSPQIIVLDVMMPQVDGWRVLGRLRQHPLTGHIPVVVCTILSQEALALSLGASAFIRKPITRRAFLAALDDQVAPMGKGSD